MFFNHHNKFFVEYKFAENVKLYFEDSYFLKDLKFYDKTYYQGHIEDGVVGPIENQINRANPGYYLVLKATFSVNSLKKAMGAFF